MSVIIGCIIFSVIVLWTLRRREDPERLKQRRIQADFWCQQTQMALLDAIEAEEEGDQEALSLAVERGMLANRRYWQEWSGD